MEGVAFEDAERVNLDGPSVLRRTSGGSASSGEAILLQLDQEVFAYDHNWNMITKNDGTDSWTYSYDYNNMMTKAVKNSVTQGQYYYDGEGKRVKIESSTTRVYSFIGLDIISEKEIGSGTVTKLFYANGLLISRVAPLATTYFHQDALGSTRLVTSATKSGIFSSNYKPFGPGYGASGPNATSEKVKYTGKWGGLAYKTILLRSKIPRP